MATTDASEKPVERIPTHVRGLDDKLEGGIPKGHIVLVCGTAGSMKSSFAFSILYNGAKEHNRKAIYLTLEQGKASLLRQMAKLGMDVTKDKALEERIAIVDLAHLRKDLKELAGANWMQSLISQIKKYKQYLGFEEIAIDSLEALYILSSMQNPRNELFLFFEQLRDLGLTSFLISEMGRDGKTFGSYGIEDFLADGVIHLNVERSDRTVDRYVSVVKMRETKHDMSYFPLLVEGGFEIVTR